MLIATAEVRWFFAEPLPTTAATWFCRGEAWIREQPRTDRYLLLPDCDYVGVKVRQGRIEVKAQRGDARRVGFPHDVQGRSDNWIKWSSDHAAPPSWIGKVTSREDQWIDVRKERWIRRFAVTADSVRELPRDQPMRAEGCNLELTRLSLRREPWWSLSLEAFGNRAGLEELLDRVGNRFFASEAPPVPLREESSLAYPAWLAKGRLGAPS